MSKLGEYGCPGCMTLICHRETSSQFADYCDGEGVWELGRVEIGLKLGIRDSIGRRRNGAS